MSSLLPRNATTTNAPSRPRPRASATSPRRCATCGTRTRARSSCCRGWRGRCRSTRGNRTGPSTSSGRGSAWRWTSSVARAPRRACARSWPHSAAGAAARVVADDPPAAPHTFEMVLTLAGEGGETASPAQYVDDVIGEVSRTKPVRSHFTFTQGLQGIGGVGILAGVRAAVYRRLQLHANDRRSARERRLQINVTTAGRAALLNPENTGTSAVRLEQIGISASSAGLVGGALAGELKRLGTFAGATVADDTIHVTVRDDSQDVYTLRAFAFYLGDGTLFACVRQADTILEKSAQAMMLLAADVRFAHIDATALTFGDTDWINPPAPKRCPACWSWPPTPKPPRYLDQCTCRPPQRAERVARCPIRRQRARGVREGICWRWPPPPRSYRVELGSAALRNEGARQRPGRRQARRPGRRLLPRVGEPDRQARHLRPGRPLAHWADIADPPATATRWPSWARGDRQARSLPLEAPTPTPPPTSPPARWPSRESPRCPSRRATGRRRRPTRRRRSTSRRSTGWVQAAGNLIEHRRPTATHAGQNAHLRLRRSRSVSLRRY